MGNIGFLVFGGGLVVMVSCMGMFLLLFIVLGVFIIEMVFVIV